MANSKAKAIALGLRRYFTGEPCIHGHVAERNVASGMCLRCAADNRKKRLRNNSELRIKNGKRTPEQKKQHAEYMKKRFSENPGLSRASNLKKFYGITQEEYELLLKSQKGACAICQATKVGNAKHVNLFVDHCHNSKIIRGLLCHNCNAMLGHAKDDPFRLRAAADYLENAKSISDAVIRKSSDFLPAEAAEAA